MKVLKKILTLLLAATLVFSAETVYITASADASRGAPDQHIALRLWTQILVENGIDFNEFGSSYKDSQKLESMLKEKDISAVDFCSANIEGVKEFTKLLAENGMDDGEINMTFIMYMLGLKALINDPCSRSYDCQPGIPENEEKIQKLLDQGYIWSDENGWEFDVEEYMLMNGYFPSGRYSYTTNVSSSIAVSGDTVTCRSKVVGNNRTTKINTAQYLEKRSGMRWETVKAWSRAASRGDMSLTNSTKIKNGSYRLRSVFKVYSGGNSETVVRYSAIVHRNTSSAGQRETDVDSLYDFSGDGFFGLTDIEVLQNALSNNTATPDMDVNGDGKVNVFDLVAVKRMVSDGTGSDGEPVS